MRNVAAVLAERGLTFADVVKATVHLDDLGDFAEYNLVYESFLESPTPCAPRSARRSTTSSSRSTSWRRSRSRDPRVACQFRRFRVMGSIWEP